MNKFSWENITDLCIKSVYVQICVCTVRYCAVSADLHTFIIRSRSVLNRYVFTFLHFCWTDPFLFFSVLFFLNVSEFASSLAPVFNLFIFSCVYIPWSNLCSNPVSRQRISRLVLNEQFCRSQLDNRITVCVTVHAASNSLACRSALVQTLTCWKHVGS